jgi:hypothetical protein
MTTGLSREFSPPRPWIALKRPGRRKRKPVLSQETEQGAESPGKQKSNEKAALQKAAFSLYEGQAPVKNLRTAYHDFLSLESILS